MKIPLLDLKTQYVPLEKEILQEISEICMSQLFILGPKVKAFEESICEYCKTSFACGVSSGSDALLMSLMAEDIGCGDEVITSPYTFFSTAGAISRVGATPVFVDIDPASFTIDNTLIEAKITPKTKAIIPVHIFGQPCNLDPIMDLAKKYNLIVIEDSAQAIGAEYKGHRMGYYGDYSCISFFPSKNLGGFGDAGIITCNNEDKYNKLMHLRNHGMNPQYHHGIIGGNFRIDALQAAILNIKLKSLDKWTAGRQDNAKDYDELLGGHENWLQLPSIAPWTTRHVFNQFIIRVKNGFRNRLLEDLQKAEIGCAIYYPIPLHLQNCYKDLDYQVGDLPESEKAANETLAIPIYPELTHIQKKYITDTIMSCLEDYNS
ncbi:MAG: DegT/DnrJ/EryC1/StrS family aminotransferase [Lentisphaeria bacterium]